MSAFRITGRIAVETRDADTGRVIPEESGVTDNIVVDVGLAELAAILAKESPSEGYKIAVGTGTTTPAGTDSTLGTEVYRSVVTQVTRSGAAVSYRLYIDSASANGYTLSEAGLFHNAVMIDRSLITNVSKTASKTVTVTVTLTVQR